MTTLALRRRARELWNTPHNQRKWVRSVLQLSEKWLLAKQVTRNG
jgi:hypothetical protein